MLAKANEFLLLTIFQRIDQQKKNGINSIDLATFFKENHTVMSEANCFMLVQQNDSNSDGLLSFADLQTILCPSTYSASQNLKAARKNAQYGIRPSQLTHEIEYGVS